MMLIAVFAIAQQPATDKEYSFTHYSTGTGLVSNQVNTVIQDDEGYIWIGATDGLQRFDGTRYKTFRHNKNDSTSLPSNPVWQLLIDKKKNLWVLLADGKVGIFNTKTFTFREAVVTAKNPHALYASLKQVHTDEYGHVFLLLAGWELLTWNETKNEFSSNNNFFKQKPEWSIADFVHQPGTHKYWISIQGGGLAVYNHSTGNLSYLGHNVEKEAAIENSKSLTTSVHLHFDKRGRLWLINWNPVVPLVYCYNLKADTFVEKGLQFNTYFKSYHELHGFFETKDSSIWLRGVPVFAKYLEGEKRFEMVHNGYNSEQGISFSTITFLCEDKERNMWVATSNNGLYRFNPATGFFTNVKHINHNNLKTGEGSPMSFFATRWGTVLAGTWGDGLYAYNSKDFSTAPLGIKNIDDSKTRNLFAWCMTASKDSNSIWIAAQPGIYKINQASKTIQYYNPPILENRTVRQVAEDKYGNLWLGMQSRGVYKWTKAKGEKRFEDGLEKFSAIPNGLIGKITIDSKGLVWLASSLKGVYVIDPGTNNIVMHFSDSAESALKLPEPAVSDIMEYDDSTMIITTTTYIISYNRNSKRSSLIGPPGVVSGYITAMEKDKSGYIWLTSTNGLYRINLKNGLFINFNRADGIENESFIQASSYVLPDGRMIFGSTNHFIVFDPAAFKPNNSFFSANITDFKVFNKSLQLDSLLKLKEIELEYDQNSLNIEFSSLHYNTPSLIKYKMDGLDKDWITADKNNQAIYNYLPPGDYTFTLKIINEDGKESPELTTIHLKINAPFWKTWWFYSLLLLFAGALLFWLDRQRAKRKEAIQKMRTTIADNLHKEVNMALSNINILSEMGKLKAEKDPQKTKEFIEQIHSKSFNMMNAMDDMLWSINPDNDSMAKAMERLKEHVDGLRSRFAVQIDLLVDKKAEQLKPDMILRQNIFWFLKSGSTNIVRTGGTDCKIHVGFEKPNLVYTLDFDNTHTDTLQLNNLLQRQELVHKLEEVHATMDVQLHKSRTIIELIIPVNQ